MWGTVYDFVTAFGKALRLGIVQFLLDVLMMSAFAFSFFSLLIGYNKGQIRSLLLVASLIGFVLYICTVHRVLERVFDKILKFFHKRVKKLTNSLKNCKKS